MSMSMGDCVCQKIGYKSSAVAKRWHCQCRRRDFYSTFISAAEVWKKKSPTITKGVRRDIHARIVRLIRNQSTILSRSKFSRILRYLPTRPLLETLKKGGRKLRRTTTPNNINNIQSNDNGKKRAGLGRGADTRVG